MKIGFIGLGKMGSVLAPHLAGHTTQIIGYDLNWQLPAESPIKRAASLAEVSECVIIFTMLPDGVVVEETVTALLQYGTRALFVDMSSCHPETSVRLAELLAPTGHSALDAPVSGGVGKAQDGNLMIMTGGEQADFTRAKPLLEAMGKPVHIGPAGAGYTMKALNNYVSAAGLVTSFQALATAQKFGITPENFQTIINASTGRNNTTEIKIDKFVLTQAFNSGFALNLMAKDVAIASDIIAENGYMLPLTGDLADYLKEALEALGGDPDHTEIYRHLERLAAK